MIETRVICDGCREFGAASDNKIHGRRLQAHHMRSVLRKLGWLIIEAGGKDYCPECRPKKKKE